MENTKIEEQSQEIYLLGKYFEKQTHQLIRKYHQEAENLSLPLIDRHEHLITDFSHKLEEEFLPIFQRKNKFKKLSFFSFNSVTKTFLHCFQIINNYFIKEMRMQRSKLRKTRPIIQVKQQNQICRKCEGVMESKNIQLEKLWLGLGKIEDPYNMFSDSFFEDEKEQRILPNPKKQETEVDETKKCIQNYLDCLEDKIKKRKEQIEELIDQIMNFKDQFNTHRFPKEVNINIVYEKITREFQGLGQYIYQKMSDLFWNHIQRKVKDFSNVGIQIKIDQATLNQIEKMKLQKASLNKFYEKKVESLYQQLKIANVNQQTLERKISDIEAKLQFNKQLNAQSLESLNKCENELNFCKDQLKKKEELIRKLKSQKYQLQKSKKQSSNRNIQPQDPIKKKSSNQFSINNTEQSLFSESFQNLNMINLKNQYYKKYKKPRNSHQIVRDSYNLDVPDPIQEDSLNIKKNSQKRKKTLLGKERLDKEGIISFFGKNVKKSNLEQDNLSSQFQHASTLKSIIEKENKIVESMNHKSQKSLSNLKNHIIEQKIKRQQLSSEIGKQYSQKSSKKVSQKNQQINKISLNRFLERKKSRLLSTKTRMRKKSSLHQKNTESMKIQQLKNILLTALIRKGIKFDTSKLHAQAQQFFTKVTKQIIIKQQERQYSLPKKCNLFQSFPEKQQNITKEQLLKIKSLFSKSKLRQNEIQYKIMSEKLQHEKKNLGALSKTSQLFTLNREKQESYFNIEDVKNIYFTVKGAYQHEKKKKKYPKNDEVCNPEYLKFFTQLLTELANMHILNKSSYQQVKKFLMCPYQSIICEDKYLQVASNNESRLHNSINQIILFHQTNCQSHKVCNHLQNFIQKIRKIHKKVDTT